MQILGALLWLSGALLGISGLLRPEPPCIFFPGEGAEIWHLQRPLLFAQHRFLEYALICKINLQTKYISPRKLRKTISTNCSVFIYPPPPPPQKKSQCVYLGRNMKFGGWQREELRRYHIKFIRTHRQNQVQVSKLIHHSNPHQIYKCDNSMS